MRESLKAVLGGSGLLQTAVGALRRHQLQRSYVARRERYARLAQERGLRYDAAAVGRIAASRMRNRGYTPRRRAMGEIHTFAFIPRIGWHEALYPDLRALGPLSEFDYTTLGYTCEQFFSRSAVRDRAEMNARALQAIRECHRKAPIDWIFVYASGVEILADTLRSITAELGVPLVNMCLDDKQSWEGPDIGGQRVGQIDIAREFDVSWTSARVACEWYLVEGANPLYLPEGFDSSTYRPIALTKDIPISFIGGAYGFRPAVVSELRRAGLPISVFGNGWNTTSVWGQQQVEVINRSSINLGMGGIGYSPDITNVKTRDFEIPGCGGGAYLTTFNPDLAQHFVIGEEILCYRTIEELIELARWYIARPDEVLRVAARGRERCLREHRWLHRFRAVCVSLGVLEAT